MAASTRCMMFIYCLLCLVAVIDSQECVVSLTFPLDPNIMTIIFTKLTTQAVVRVACDTTPSTNVVTTLTFSGTNSAVLVDSSPKDVTIQAGQISTDYVFEFISANTAITETFDVTLTSNDVTVATVNAVENNLTFNLENIPEVSFASPVTYEGQFGDTIDVILERVGGALTAISLNVVESGTSYLADSPSLATFALNAASATVTFTIDQRSSMDLQSILIMNGVSDNVLLTRDSDKARAFINIDGLPLVTVARPSVQLVSSLNTASFTITSSRTVMQDVTITLVYDDVYGIVIDGPSTITIPTGSNTAVATFTIEPVILQSYTVRMTSVSGGLATIDDAHATTTYTILDIIVIVTIPQRVYSVVEGETINVILSLNVPAPTTIRIDLDTVVATDQSQFASLPDAVFTVGTMSTVVGINILSDGIPEAQLISSILFRSLTSGVTVDPAANIISVTITDSVVIGSGTGTGTGTDIGTGIGVGIGSGTGTGTTTNDASLSSGAIVGIVVGAISALVIIIVVAMICGLMVMSTGRRSVAQPYVPGYGNGGYPARGVYPGYPGMVAYEVGY